MFIRDLSIFTGDITHIFFGQKIAYILNTAEHKFEVLKYDISNGVTHVKRIEIDETKSSFLVPQKDIYIEFIEKFLSKTVPSSNLNGTVALNGSVNLKKAKLITAGVPNQDEFIIRISDTDNNVFDGSINASSLNPNNSFLPDIETLNAITWGKLTDDVWRLVIPEIVSRLLREIYTFGEAYVGELILTKYSLVCEQNGILGKKTKHADWRNLFVKHAGGKVVIKTSFLNKVSEMDCAKIPNAIVLPELIKQMQIRAH